MPWNQDDGNQGPWGQTGGNPQNEGGNQSPWGQNNNERPRQQRGPQRPSGGGGSGLPPDLDDLLKRGSQRFKGAIPGSGGGLSGLFLPLLVLGGFWLYNSVYQVQPDEKGVVLRLGEFSRTVDPGLQFAPWPIERIEKPKTGAVNQISIGSDQSEGQMLTGDKNIINVPFTVQWRIADPKDFLFNIATQERTLRALAQSAMREVVAQNSAQAVLTSKKSEIAAQVQTITQKLLDEYKAGVIITALNLGETQPPPEVADAFADVVRAEQNRKQLENEAQQYRNQRDQEAEGQVGKLIEEAGGYKASAIADAQGEAARFTSVYDEYKNAKDVTRQRIFLETMEQVLSKTNKVVIEGGQGGQGSGVVPYLPLPQIQNNQNKNEN
jgi:modulator of FtsH protease HflK